MSEPYECVLFFAAMWQKPFPMIYATYQAKLPALRALVVAAGIIAMRASQSLRVTALTGAV